MKKKLFETGNDWIGFIGRIALGLLILPHGLQKAFGWFNGYGFEGTMGFFTETIGLPWILGAFIIFTEVAGSLLLVLGLLSRFWALMVICIMFGTIFTYHGPVGFFMNWDGNLKGEGYEYHLAVSTIALIVLIKGAGRYSIDRIIASKQVDPGKAALAQRAMA
jgi:putative oxidoreductase